MNFKEEILYLKYIL